MIPSNLQRWQMATKHRHTNPDRTEVIRVWQTLQNRSNSSMASPEHQTEEDISDVAFDQELHPKPAEAHLVSAHLIAAHFISRARLLLAHQDRQPQAQT